MLQLANMLYVCYGAGFDREGKRYSLLQYVLRETEQLHAKLRRYTSPDEHPFFPDELPPMV
jgi:chorismate mutase